MKIPAIQKMRIPLLLALACSEIAAIFIVHGQPGFHVELETAVGVHVLPDQRRHGAEVSCAELS